MPKLIEVRYANLKGVERELRRLNERLEFVITHYLGLSLYDGDGDGKDESEVGYATDRETFRNELIDVRDGRNPERPIGPEDDDAS